jgi:hypothetical protein
VVVDTVIVQTLLRQLIRDSRRGGGTYIEEERPFSAV